MVNVLSFVVKLKTVDEKLGNAVLFDLINWDVLEEEAKTKKEVELELEFSHMRNIVDNEVFYRQFFRIFEVFDEV